MILPDEELERELKALERIFNNETIFKIKSHILSLSQQIEALRSSRDRWKKLCLEMKDKKK